MILSDDNDTIEELGFEGFAALWGCDPCYDHPPRLRGDGYHFYNFAVEGEDLGFLKTFLPAVERTILEVNQSNRFNKEEKEKNLENLEWLKREVERRIAIHPQQLLGAFC